MNSLEKLRVIRVEDVQGDYIAIRLIRKQVPTLATMSVQWQ